MLAVDILLSLPKIYDSFYPAHLGKHDGEALVMLIRRDNHDHAEPIKHKKIQD